MPMDLRSSRPIAAAEDAVESPGVSLGLEWVVDASGCDPARLRDRACVEALARHLMTALGLKAAAPPLVHPFPGQGGITAMVLLTESHLAIHTFPEHRALTLNVYCCRARPPFAWAATIGERFGATSVEVRELPRRAREPAP
jgi:S-adenosylmethionine decarboxylase